jgi:hypothetical protein
MLPSYVLKMVKRSMAYRAVRCHVADPCPEDAWTDGPTAAFVVFRLAGTPVGTHVVFVVDRKHSEVTQVRVLDLTASSVRPWDVGLLPTCSERAVAAPRALRLSEPPMNYESPATF